MTISDSKETKNNIGKERCSKCVVIWGIISGEYFLFSIEKCAKHSKAYSDG